MDRVNSTASVDPLGKNGRQLSIEQEPPKHPFGHQDAFDMLIG